MGLLLSVAACGSDDRDGADDDSNPNPGEIDGGSPDGQVIVDIDATFRPDSTVTTNPDGSLDGSADTGVVSSPDGAVLGSTCADGLPRVAANTERRDVRQTTPSIEGVAACPNGDVFVSAASAGEVWRVPFAGGAPEVWFKQDGALLAGLDCDPQNRLYAADYGWGLTRGGVLSITGKNAGTALPPPGDFATQGYQGVLAVEGKGIYGSDPVQGRIMLWHDVNGVTTATIASNDADGASGLALGTDGRLYVALQNSALFDDEVVSFAIGSDGTLADRKRAWSGPQVINAIAIDENNGLYISIPSEGKVVRASDGATVATVTNATGLAFRGSTLLVTEFDRDASRAERTLPIYVPVSVGHLWAIDLGVCGR